MKTSNLTIKDKELIKKAEQLWKKKYISKRHSVASILVSKSGKFFEGMSMEFNCGIAICGERVSMFKMMPDESEIDTIVAVYKNTIMPPCGVCRELMYEINEKNLKNTWVIISKTKKVKLGELLPEEWGKVFK